MSATFPPDLQQFVQQELASGHYRSEDELLSGPFLSRQQHPTRSDTAGIEGRLQQLDEGQGIELADDAAAEAFFDEIDPR